MKVYAVCVNPTKRLDKITYLVEPCIKTRSLGYMTVPWHDAEYVKVLNATNRGGYNLICRIDRFKICNNKLNDHMSDKVIYKTQNIEPVYNYVDSHTYELNISKNRVKDLMETDSTGLERRIYKTYIKEGSIVTEDITDQIKTKTTYIIP